MFVCVLVCWFRLVWFGWVGLGWDDAGRYGYSTTWASNNVLLMSVAHQKTYPKSSRLFLDLWCISFQANRMEMILSNFPRPPIQQPGVQLRLIAFGGAGRGSPVPIVAALHGPIDSAGCPHPKIHEP